MKRHAPFWLLAVLVVAKALACEEQESPPTPQITAGSGSGEAGASGGASAGNASTGGQSGNGGIGGKGGSKGGSAGKAGSAGVAHSGASGGPSVSCEPDQPLWTCDPSLWKPISAKDNPCQFVEVDQTEYSFPPFVWQDCGIGCKYIHAALAPAQRSYHSSGVFYKNGKTYLKLDVGWASFGKGQATLFASSSSGDILKTVFARNISCVPLQFGRDSASTIRYAAESDGGLAYSVGMFEPSTQPIINWQYYTIPRLGIPNAAFDWDDGWGILADGGLGIVTSLEAQKFTILGSSPGYSAAGHGSVLVWPGFSPNQEFQLKRYSASDGVSSLLSLPSPQVINRVALSPDHLVWVHTTGNGSGTYYEAYLSWAPFPSTNAPILNPTTLPLDAKTGLLELKTWGDYAATLSCPELGPCRRLIVQLSTKKTWELYHRPNQSLSWLIGMTPTEIFYGEIELGGDPTSFERIVKLELAHLDELVQAWKP